MGSRGKDRPKERTHISKFRSMLRVPITNK